MMDDSAVFTDFVTNTLGVTTQQTIGLIKNSVESFGDLLAVNDGDIDIFVKDYHSVNNAREASQRILIRKNVTQGLKSMFFCLKDIELCNDFPDEVSLHGINTG